MTVVPSSRRLHITRTDLQSGSTDGEDDAFAEHCDHQRPSPRTPPPPSLAQSRVVLEAMADESSMLARFLFVGDDEDEVMPSLSRMEAAFLALELEPMHVRNDRIAQIFEAFAIFGALFMNGVWIIYEWGSAKGYGGDGINVVAGRVFECVMALALVCNTFLACFGATLWLLSLFWNSSHEEYAFHSRKALVYLVNLLNAIPGLVMVGIILGLYSNLAPHWPETIVCMLVAAIVVVVGMKWMTEFQLATAPLECYHSRAWFRAWMFPQLAFSRRKREDLRSRAMVRAAELRERAYQQRKAPVPGPNVRNNNDSGVDGVSPMGALLRKAAVNLGRADSDISVYEARLEADWIGKPEQLKGVGVDSLTRYMPFGLAREVHKLLEEAVAS